MGQREYHNRTRLYIMDGKRKCVYPDLLLVALPFSHGYPCTIMVHDMLCILLHFHFVYHHFRIPVVSNELAGDCCNTLALKLDCFTTLHTNRKYTNSCTKLREAASGLEIDWDNQVQKFVFALQLGAIEKVKTFVYNMVATDGALGLSFTSLREVSLRSICLILRSTAS